MLALLIKCCPLRNAKAVLLVGDSQPQPIKAYILLNNSMSSDNNIKLMTGYSFQCFPPIFCSKTSYQQTYPDLCILKHFCKLGKMLTGQNLRWGHEGTLIAVLYGLH